MTGFLKQSFLVLLITIIFAVMTLLAAEGFARWQIDHKITPLTHYLATPLGLSSGALTHPTWSLRMIPTPFAHLREEPATLDGVSVFPEGYRGVENQNPFGGKPDNPSIYVYGGALSFGYGLDDAQTMPSLLQKKLNQGAGDKFAVYNFSSAFDRAAEARIRLANHLIDGRKPRAAVVVAGWGDFVFASGREGPPHGPMPFKPFDVPMTFTDFLQSSYFFGYLSRILGFADPITPLANPAPGFSEASEADIDLARRNLSADLTMIETTAAAENIKLVIALEPAIHGQQRKGYEGLSTELEQAGLTPLPLTGDPRGEEGQRANAEQIALALEKLLAR